jgi:hypothetical protein
MKIHKGFGYSPYIRDIQGISNGYHVPPGLTIYVFSKGMWMKKYTLRRMK